MITGKLPLVPIIECMLILVFASSGTNFDNVILAKLTACNLDSLKVQ